jgi:hypothetical protein
MITSTASLQKRTIQSHALGAGMSPNLYNNLTEEVPTLGLEENGHLLFHPPCSGISL